MFERVPVGLQRKRPAFDKLLSRIVLEKAADGSTQLRLAAASCVQLSAIEFCLCLCYVGPFSSLLCSHLVHCYIHASCACRAHTATRRAGDLDTKSSLSGSALASGHGGSTLDVSVPESSLQSQSSLADSSGFASPLVRPRSSGGKGGFTTGSPKASPTATGGPLSPVRATRRAPPPGMTSSASAQSFGAWLALM